MCKCLLILLAFLCPPLAVLIHQGCGCAFCINLILTLLIWIPGVIHALYIICTKERRRDE